MWKTGVSRKTAATPRQIWSVWTDVAHWNRCDADITRSELSGAFETGSTGVIKPQDGPQTKRRIITCTVGKSFTHRTIWPLCTVDFIHEITASDDGTLVTHRIEIKGGWYFLFVRIMGRPREKILPDSGTSLVKMAEEDSHTDR